MLITCSGCNSKIRVPESAAGKRVSVPKCATLIRVPDAENAPSSETPEKSGISSTPIPPPPATEPEGETEVESDSNSERPSSSGAKPPPIKKQRASSIEDDDDEEDDEPKPPSKRRRDRDDDDDEDDRDLDVRKRRRKVSEQPGVNGLAITSMILGIAAVITMVLGNCCLGPATGGFASFFTCPVALICAGISIVLGFMGNKPGSAGFAWTGIICSFVVFAFTLLGVVLVLIFGMALIAGAGVQQPPGRRF